MGDFQSQVRSEVIGQTDERPSDIRRRNAEYESDMESPEARNQRALRAEMAWMNGEDQPAHAPTPAPVPLPVWASHPKPTPKKAPPPIAYETVARANLGAAIENHRFAIASLREIRETIAKTSTSRSALRRELDTAKRILDTARGSSASRAFENARSGGPMGEDPAIPLSEAALAKAQRDFDAADRTAEMLKSVEQEASFAVSNAQGKVEEAARIVSKEAIPALIAKGLAAQAELHRIRATAELIFSGLRSASPDIMFEINRLYAPGIDRTDPAVSPWAIYLNQLREDATVAAPD